MSSRAPVVAVVALAALVSGCKSQFTGGPSTTVPVGTTVSGEPGRPDPGQFLAADPAVKRAKLTMIGGLGSSNNGFNFDDYGRGELLVSVPRGWRVTVDCQNHASRRTSCAVVTGARSATIAFPGASVAHPLQGLAPGSKERFSFTAGHTGVFRITSLVPGQSEARMFAVLEVTRAGSPSISARPGP